MDKKKQTEHVVKLVTKFFDAPWSNMVQLRKNDRDYQPGDLLFLHEYDPIQKRFPGRYMGRQITRVITNEDPLLGMGISPGWAFLILDFIDEKTN